jgi:hypothetical protein
MMKNRHDLLVLYLTNNLAISGMEIHSGNVDTLPMKNSERQEQRFDWLRCVSSTVSVFR